MQIVPALIWTARHSHPCLLLHDLQKKKIISITMTKKLLFPNNALQYSKWCTATCYKTYCNIINDALQYSTWCTATSYYKTMLQYLNYALQFITINTTIYNMQNCKMYHNTNLPVLSFSYCVLILSSSMFILILVSASSSFIFRWLWF